MGLILSGGYVLSGVAPASAQDPQAAAADRSDASTQPAQAEMPADEAPKDASTEAAPKTAELPKNSDASKSKATEEKVSKAKAPADKDVGTIGPGQGKTRSELAVLEGLANRRKTLDQREREIDLRENLLKAAEKRVEARIAELKTIESRIESELKKRDDHRTAEYERLVKMYSGMKPKDAARIFDRLELDVLTGLVAQMKPRVMSAVLAVMNPAAAERLTLEIANRGRQGTQTAATLPKIESRRAN
jgi:flagellar motility protein MotE (MotC chaperone)